MADVEEEVYFIASSSSSDNGDALAAADGHHDERPVGDRPAPTAASPAAPGTSASPRHLSPRDTPAPVSPSMEDVLFGLAPPRARPQPQTPPPHVSEGQTGAVDVVGTAAPATTAAAAAAPVYAGGSPCAMPKPQFVRQPRTLAELGALTSADVRDVLERFFLRKDALAKRFKTAEAALLSNVTTTAAASTAPAISADGGVDAPGASAALQREERLARDRCRRLVNVSNWEAAVDGSSVNDVLLPAALLPDLDDAVGPASIKTNASAALPSSSAAAAAAVGLSTTGATSASTRRTLRPHQVEGIRFLWGVLAEGPAGQVPAVGCILAHTMGLGKTAQVVVFLHLYMAAFPRDGHASLSSSLTAASAAHPTTASSFSQPPSGIARPRVLVVVPKSVQSGWRREFELWSTAFPVEYRIRPIAIRAEERVQQRLDSFHAWRRHGGVLLIGYESLVHLMRVVESDAVLQQPPAPTGAADAADGVADARAFHLTGGTAPATLSDQQQRQRRTEQWARRNDEGGVAFGGAADPFTELVVCDEAHRLKSVHLNIVTALRGLHPLRRLLLTGTPLQNHLHEYWAMMDFCVHKYFSRRRFREFFIQPIESSANTRASEKEVDLARKKTFTLINEVRHFLQRVDSAPLQAELPPLHEYTVVVPLSALQADLYRRFVRTALAEETQRLQLLQAVSYSGKIAAHPQLLFQLRERWHRAGVAVASAGSGSPSNAAARGLLAGSKRRTGSSRGTGRLGNTSTSLSEAHPPAPQRPRHDASARDEGAEEVVVSDSDDDDDDSTSGGSSSGTEHPDPNENGAAASRQAAGDTEDASEDEGDGDGGDGDGDGAAVLDTKAFTRASRRSLSSLPSPSALTYEKLCVPPTPHYKPELEHGVKLHVAMRLIAAAMAKSEKVLFFSLSTQLLSLFEVLIAKANVLWRRPGEGARGGGTAAAAAASAPLLARPIRYCRLDGSHTVAQRAAMVDDFQRPDGADVFLLSVKAGGVGLTITAATRVILADTSFNPADDQQAIGRAYRYGQTRPVYVYRLMCYPTLEYSIFSQKLAKEWLFKTVIEESTVKRDGLSGMHLRELYTLLTQAARVLERPARATRAQLAATAEVLREDPMLGEVQADVLYAQRYEVFLEHDHDDQYGADEAAFYEDYCRTRVFDAADDSADAAERQRAAELQRRRQQRVDEATQLQAQSKTLTSMVDDLIRSRAGTDFNLARLLTAMGLRVDPATGRAQTRHASSEGSTPPPPLRDIGERFAPSPVQLVGREGSNFSSAAPAVPVDGNGGAGDSSHSSRQTAVMLLDSDEDSLGPANGHVVQTLPRNSSGNGAAAAVGRTHTQHTPRALGGGDRIAASLARQPYAPYRPGSSAAYAVDIDGDGSQ